MPNKPPSYRPPRKGPKPSETARGSASERGYGWRWQQTARHYLDRHPLCVSCAEQGRTTLATCVDHKDGLGPLGARGYDEDNFAALCASCHSRKTVAEDGGFGRAPEPRA